MSKSIAAPFKLLLITPRRKDGDIKPYLYDEWNRAIQEYIDPTISSRVSISVFKGRLGEIEASELQCDCIVSPANSYGIMDGGFDLELSRVFKGKDGDDWTLTNHCQTFIREKSGGYLPPGSCMVVPLPEHARGPSGNPWNVHSLAILPTMRTPEDVSWNRDLVYNAMWALLAQIGQWNSGRPDATMTAAGKRINTVLMTGLGTGTGSVPVGRCARQMILAVKHFTEGVPVRPRWDSVDTRNEEIRKTYTHG